MAKVTAEASAEVMAKVMAEVTAKAMAKATAEVTAKAKARRGYGCYGGQANGQCDI